MARGCCCRVQLYLHDPTHEERSSSADTGDVVMSMAMNADLADHEIPAFFQNHRQRVQCRGEWCVDSLATSLQVLHLPIRREMIRLEDTAIRRISRRLARMA